MAATGPSSPDTTKETPESPAKDAANNDAAASSQCADSAAAATTAPPAPAAAAKSDDSASSASSAMPTYLITQQSRAYTLSKKFLASGELDNALSTLEMALQLSREMLANILKGGEGDDGCCDDDIELHESLAPLYYLYGTTLLYSVEESDVMMSSGNNQQGEVADVEVPSDNEAENDDNAEQPGDDEEDEEEEAAPVDPTEDLQIAWENLDLARSIVSRLVEGFHQNDDDSNVIVLKSDDNEPNSNTTTNYTPDQQTSLLLDLAQIHTRLGDLQRANANILPCIDDYNLALKLRIECSGKFDKKVAYSHFSLAGVYAEAPASFKENEGRVDQFVSGLGGNDNGSSGVDGFGDGGGGTDSEQKELSEEEKVEFRQRSLEHYLACGVAFAGLMAAMCGEDAKKLTNVDCGENGVASASAAVAASASTSTSTSDGNHHSKTMAMLCERIASLQPPTTSETAREEFNDLKETMDEIQEAIDSAEETEEGLKSLGEMKAHEMKKHDMKQNGQEDAKLEGGSGATTTIGFGASSSSSSSAVNAAFGSSTTAAATIAMAAPTMMVVKKKKKKPQDDDSAKRIKST